MPGSTRIKGAALALSFGGTDYWADVTSVVLDNEDADSDVTTFADAAAGGARQFFFTANGITSTQSGSFWRYVWASTSNIVAYRYAPHGNAVATADQPHLTGTVKIGPKPAIGGEAGSTQTFEVRFDAQEDPTLDVGSSAAAAITAILPTGKTVGQQVIVSGTRFTGATDVKFATVSATSISVISDTTIVATIPAGTGVKAVTVITPAGTSAVVNYTVV
jgi:hypothetical protein